MTQQTNCTTGPAGPRLTVLPNTGFIRARDLIPTFVPWSYPTLRREVRRGTFPAPVRLTARTVAWKVEEVRAWLDARSA